MSKTPISLKWLIYTFLIGFSASASFSILTVSLLHFSPFPFIALYFSVNQFYSLYIKEESNEQTIQSSWIALLIGLFSYSALIVAQHPELGSNLISIALTLSLGIWLMYKVMFGDKHYSA